MTTLFVVGGVVLFALQVLACLLVFKFDDEVELPSAPRISHVRIVHKNVA